MLRFTSRSLLASARSVSRTALRTAPVAFQQQRFMSSMDGTKTLQNLKDAFAGECMAHARYQFFAQRADVEGYVDQAIIFRSLAESELNHAMGHLEFLMESGDPVTHQPMGNTRENLASAQVGEHHDSTEMYVQMAATARTEGLEEAADWFDTLASAEATHLKVVQRSQLDMDDLDAAV